MKAMKGKVLVGVAALGVVFTAGTWTGWAARSGREDEARQRVALVRDLEIAGLCANGLKSIQAEKSATAAKVLEWRMNAAMADASRRVASRPGWRGSPRSVTEGVRRARDYARGRKMSAVMDQCERVLQSLAARPAG